MRPINFNFLNPPSGVLDSERRSAVVQRRGHPAEERGRTSPTPTTATTSTARGMRRVPSAEMPASSINPPPTSRSSCSTSIASRRFQVGDRLSIKTVTTTNADVGAGGGGSSSSPPTSTCVDQGASSSAFGGGAKNGGASPSSTKQDHLAQETSTSYVTGTVRYRGLTSFASGMWIGLVLDEPVGKNDGSVNGVRYFNDCAPGCGLFLRASSLEGGHVGGHGSGGGVAGSSAAAMTGPSSSLGPHHLASGGAAPHQLPSGGTAPAPARGSGYQHLTVPTSVQLSGSSGVSSLRNSKNNPGFGIAARSTTPTNTLGSSTSSRAQLLEPSSSASRFLRMNSSTRLRESNSGKALHVHREQMQHQTLSSATGSNSSSSSTRPGQVTRSVTTGAALGNTATSSQHASTASVTTATNTRFARQLSSRSVAPRLSSSPQGSPRTEARRANLLRGNTNTSLMTGRGSGSSNDGHHQQGPAGAPSVVVRTSSTGSTVGGTASGGVPHFELVQHQRASSGAGAAAMPMVPPGQNSKGVNTEGAAAGAATSSGATTSGSPFSATTGDLQGNSYLLCQYYNYETPQKCLQQPASPESSPPIFVEQPLKKSESLRAAADKDQGGAAAMITPAGGNASGNGAGSRGLGGTAVSFQPAPRASSPVDTNSTASPVSELSTIPSPVEPDAANLHATTPTTPFAGSSPTSFVPNKTSGPATSTSAPSANANPFLQSASASSQLPVQQLLQPPLSSQVAVTKQSPRSPVAPSPMSNRSCTSTPKTTTTTTSSPRPVARIISGTRTPPSPTRQQHIDVWSRFEEEEERDFLAESATVSTIENYLQINYPNEIEKVISEPPAGAPDSKSQTRPADRTRGPARGDPHLDPTHAGSPLRPKSPAPSSAPSSPDTGADSPSLTTTTIIPEQQGNKLHTLRSSSSSRARSRSGSNLPPESEIDGTPRPPHNKSPRPPSRAASSTSSRDRFQSYFPASTPKLGFEFDFDHITEQSIDALVERVKTNPDETLPEEFVKSLIRRTERLYERLYTQPLVHLEPPANGRMVIVGDTHGQLEDLFWIVFKYGRPSPTNVYFFNGDMVDRGSRGTEILILMYAFHLWDPACIHVNRGNHEDANMNERDRSIGGGFAQECRGKYGNAIYASIQRTFNLMPLGTVVSHKLLIIHGGLFRCPGVTLQHINRVNRVRPCPEHPNTVADWIFFDSLWSDPNPGKSKGISKRGDDCFSFGSETTRRFLKENNLHMVVRSHELPSNSRGFQVHHDSKLITIFSASNYCGTSANYGAVMLLQPSLEFEIFEHWAPELQEIVDLEQENQLACKAVLHTLEDLTRKEETYRNHMRRKSACQLETEIITKLKVKICEKKEELAWWFTYNNSSASGSSGSTNQQEAAPARGGSSIGSPTATSGIGNAAAGANGSSISFTTFVEGLSAVIGESVPWRDLLARQDLLNVMSTTTSSFGGATTGTEPVNWRQFLDRFRVELDGLNAVTWRRDAVATIFSAILRAKLPLRQLFALFDPNLSGVVSAKSFRSVTQSFDLGLTDSELNNLFHLLSGGKEQSCFVFLCSFEKLYRHVCSKFRATSPTSANAMKSAGITGGFSSSHNNSPSFSLLKRTRKRIFKSKDGAAGGAGAGRGSEEATTSGGQPAAEQPSLLHLFEKCDTDQDGFLNVQELSALLACGEEEARAAAKEIESASSAAVQLAAASSPAASPSSSSTAPGDVSSDARASTSAEVSFCALLHALKSTERERHGSNSSSSSSNASTSACSSSTSFKDHSLPPTSCISSDYRTLLDGDDRLDGLALMLYHNRRGLRRALQHFDPKSSYLVKRKHFRYALQGLAVANCANKHRNILSSLGGGGGGAGGMKTLDAIWGDFLGQLKTVELDVPEAVADEVDLAIDHGPAPGAAAGAGGSVEAPTPPPGGAAGASVVATKTPEPDEELIDYNAVLDSFVVVDMQPPQNPLAAQTQFPNGAAGGTSSCSRNDHQPYVRTWRKRCSTLNPVVVQQQVTNSTSTGIAIGFAAGQGHDAAHASSSSSSSMPRKRVVPPNTIPAARGSRDSGGSSAETPPRSEQAQRSSPEHDVGGTGSQFFDQSGLTDRETVPAAGRSCAASLDDDHMSSDYDHLRASVRARKSVSDAISETLQMAQIAGGSRGPPPLTPPVAAAQSSASITNAASGGTSAAAAAPSGASSRGPPGGSGTTEPEAGGARSSGSAAPTSTSKASSSSRSRVPPAAAASSTGASKMNLKAIPKQHPLQHSGSSPHSTPARAATPTLQPSSEQHLGTRGLPPSVELESSPEAQGEENLRARSSRDFMLGLGTRSRTSYAETEETTQTGPQCHVSCKYGTPEQDIGVLDPGCSQSKTGTQFSPGEQMKNGRAAMDVGPSSSTPSPEEYVRSTPSPTRGRQSIDSRATTNSPPVRLSPMLSLKTSSPEDGAEGATSAASSSSSSACSNAGLGNENQLLSPRSAAELLGLGTVQLGAEVEGGLSAYATCYSIFARKLNHHCDGLLSYT